MHQQSNAPACRLERACAYCSGLFLAGPNAVRRGKRRFCSPACANAARRKAPPVQFDGDTFYLNPVSGSYVSDATGRLLHRVVWERANGRPLRPGYVVHHRDHDHANNDPSNLVEMSRTHTRLHNSDPERRVVPAPGSRNGRARLDEAAVEAIKSHLTRGDLYRRIAADFGVTEEAVGRIARGERWVHVLIDVPVTGRYRRSQRDDAEG
jgi:hypothetical protein